MNYFAISDVVDAQKGRGGIKRYHILAKTDLAATVSANYFNRYTLRGAQLGDIITVICQDQIVNLEIIADPDATGFWITVPLAAGGSTDAQTADLVPMNPVLTTGPAAGLADVQSVLDALNNQVQNLTVNTAITNIVNQITTNPVLVSQIWGALVAGHMGWDGNKLCLDINNNGNPAA